MTRARIGDLKALGLGEEVRQTGQPVLITPSGEAVAEVVAPSMPASAGSRFGSFAAIGRIVGDIVSPVTEEGDWDALRSHSALRQ